jgi:DNA primase large subunit
MPVPRSLPELDDEVTLARYPFLPQASGWIRSMAVDHNIDLDELLEGTWMEKARSRARIRLIDSIQSKEGVEVVGGDLFTEEGRIIEAFSFYYARLVVCASEDERLIARWAQAEAARAEQILIKDTKNIEEIARTYISLIERKEGKGGRKAAMSIGSGTGDMRALRQSQSGPLWNIGLSDFIEICPKITGARWRLPNCDVNQGWVTLFEEPTYGSSAKLARLLRERIKQSVEQDALEKMGEVTTDLAIRLAEPVGMVRNLMSNQASEAIALVGASETDWPPCMRKAVSDLATGVNLNHFGRLFLASMSAVLALPKESCVGFFRGAPDFSESTTSYQVDHVYQHGYTPSGCGKLKINHNCPVLPGDDRLCDQPWLDHPLKYIRATQRWNAKNQAAQQQAQVAPPTTEAPKDSPADDSKNESV